MQVNQFKESDIKFHKTIESNALSAGEESDRATSAYDYELPEQLIAQNPVTPRDSARLLVVDSPNSHSHRIFRDLPDLLQPGDLLVMNNTRVIPARLYGRKPSGAAVEILLLEERQNHTWLALVKPGRRLPPGAKIIFDPQPLSYPEQGEKSTQEPPIQNPKSSSAAARSAIQNPLTATVLSTDEATGGRILQFDLPAETSLTPLLEQFGHVPLPPYITQSQALPEQYQTVYAQQPGSAAAPTAGLHFTPELLERLQECGIERAFVTLHIGVGTFRPVEVEDVTTHKMHEEWVEVPAATVAKIRETKARGGRVIAVGTTVVRSLEGAAAAQESEQVEEIPPSKIRIPRQEPGNEPKIPQSKIQNPLAQRRVALSKIPLAPFCGKTDLFIYPGYQWRVVEGMITNFHLPRSSLMMLVSALIGRQRLLDLYREATLEQYRFYSFGDAMLILPAAVSG
jgi:S-adenosylmethionine:tRNA ribosyltransferase-isomerase